MERNNQEDLQYLLGQYAANQSSEAEVRMLMEKLRTATDDSELESFIKDLFIASKIEPIESNVKWELIWDSIILQIEQEDHLYEVPVEDTNILPQLAPVRRISWSRIAVAAAVLIFIALTVILSLSKDDTRKNQLATTQQIPNDVAAPAITKARITLADGRTVPLDSLSSGTLANQSGVSIIKNAAGKISYSASEAPFRGRGASITYNTLSNPRGSTVIDMQLTDGSRVWLNAGSSLTYPVTFATNERKVTMTGECYFEIAKLAGMKFIVESNGVSTEVLGTHFNVNAYEDEAETKVTLLEGSVRVSVPTSVSPVVKLIPGQQAQINKLTNQQINIAKPDLEETMSWKNGFFTFKQTNIETIMRQMARWYDVEVEYQSKSKTLFTADIPRNVKASDFFKILEATGSVHFKISGRNITVGK